MYLYHFDGSGRYKKRDLDEIVDIASENGGELNFVIPSKIAPSHIDILLILLETKLIIDKSGANVKLYILQCGDCKFSWLNDEDIIFVKPQILYGKSVYYIAVQSRIKLVTYSGRIGYIHLDVGKIDKMIKEEHGLGYMKESLNYLIRQGKVKYNIGINILDFWGSVTLHYIRKASWYTFGNGDHRINEFIDKKKLKNGDEFYIFGSELIFKYKDKELEFGVCDASHIYKEESEKHKTEMNPYLTLALFPGIVLGRDPAKEDQNTINFYRKASRITGYDILLLVVDEQPLIKEGLINEYSRVNFIREDQIPKFINIIGKIYGL